MRRLRYAVLTIAVSAAPLAAQSAQPLAVFDTAWSAMSRSYFDTTLVKGRWRAAYDSLRTSLGAAPSMDQMRDALRALIAVPGQSHFALLPPDALPSAKPSARDAGGSRGTAGIVARLAADTLIVWRVEPGSAAEASGVRPGDAITHVDAVNVDSVRQRLAQAFPASPRESNALFVMAISSLLDGPAGDTVKVTVRDIRGRAAGHVIVRGPMSGRTQQYGNLPTMVIRASLDTADVTTPRGVVHVPVIAFSGWFPVIIQDLDRYAFGARNAPAVIIDLRGNLGGAVGIIGGFAGHFSDSTWSLGTMKGRGADLRLVANPRRATSAGERVDVIRAPVAILVDGMSASASEFFAAGMQGLGRARVFGEVTAGQSLPAAMLRLASGDVLMHPIADHVDALGRRVEGIGVQPDTRTPLVRSEVAAGKDAALDAARAWLAEMLARP
jgi:carboxyl-terminal processing protease